MKHEDFLRLAEVPEHFWSDAKKSLAESRWRMVITLLAKILALVMGPIAGATAKRDAEAVRWKFLLPWDNNISINGDRAPWHQVERPDGAPYTRRGIVPDNVLYEPDEFDADGNLVYKGRPYNYYYRVGKAFARDRMARAVWLIRNPASKTATLLGKALKSVDKVIGALWDRNLSMWLMPDGSWLNNGGLEWQHVMRQWRYADGEGTEIWVIECQGVWCIRYVRPTKILGIKCAYRGGLGYKLHNIADFHPLHPDIRVSVSHMVLPGKRLKDGEYVFERGTCPAFENGVLPLGTTMAQAKAEGNLI